MTLVGLGGHSDQTAPDAKTARIPQDVNRGRHAVYTGGDRQGWVELPLTAGKL